MKVEKQVRIEEVTHHDIGKQVSFSCLTGGMKLEIKGILGGIDRMKITVKGAKFRKSSEDNWSPTQEKDPDIPVEEDTVITLYQSE